MRVTFVITIAILLFTVVSVVFAGDPGNVSVYQFEFDGQDGAVSLELNSQTMGFDLHDLQPGDIRTTMTDDGTALTITRLDEVYALDVGGEVFEIPAIHDSDHAPPGHAAHHRIAVAHGMGDGLIIMSHEPLDKTRRTSIRDALAAAGIVDEIRFLSPGLSMTGEDIEEIEVDDDGQRRMIIKHVVRD